MNILLQIPVELSFKLDVLPEFLKLKYQAQQLSSGAGLKVTAGELSVAPDAVRILDGSIWHTVK
jgi:hypothetical protein